jgi:hypothetical protein
VALIFLDNVLGIVISVKGVHENKWDIGVVCAVEVFDLPDGKIEE